MAYGQNAHSCDPLSHKYPNLLSHFENGCDVIMHLYVHDTHQHFDHILRLIHTLRLHYAAHAAANLNSGYSK